MPGEGTRQAAGGDEQAEGDPMNKRLQINRRRAMALINGGYSFGWSVYRVSRRHKLNRDEIVDLVEAVRMQLKRNHRVSTWPR